MSLTKVGTINNPSLEEEISEKYEPPMRMRDVLVYFHVLPRSLAIKKPF